MEVLEYHDVKGQYHKADYTEEAGRVSRLIRSSSMNILKMPTNDRTPANDPRNRGKKIPGWGFDPNWSEGKLQIVSLVFDAVKPKECPLQN